MQTKLCKPNLQFPNINFVTHRTDNIVRSAANTTQSVIKLCCYNRGVHKMCRLSTAFNKHLLGKIQFVTWTQPYH